MVAVAKRIALYDTTLRDGTQGAGVTLSAEDKLRIADRLDEFGIDYPAEPVFCTKPKRWASI